MPPSPSCSLPAVPALRLAPYYDAQLADAAPGASDYGVPAPCIAAPAGVDGSPLVDVQLPENPDSCLCHGSSSRRFELPSSEMRSAVLADAAQPSLWKGSAPDSIERRLPCPVAPLALRDLWFKAAPPFPAVPPCFDSVEPSLNVDSHDFLTCPDWGSRSATP